MGNKKKKLGYKLHIRKGDNVKVIAGDDKGKQGRILTILIKDNRAIVEGVNIVSRHTKPNPKDTKGGIIKKEGSIHISNLMLVDPKSGEPTRISRKREDGKAIRISKKSGEAIN